MPRDMIENERGSAINPGEAVEEKVSLSDRFGLWIGFHNTDQPTYLAMVEAYAARSRAAGRRRRCGPRRSRGRRAGAAGRAGSRGSSSRTWPGGWAKREEARRMTIATEQVPGVYRRRVGEVLVTALNDGSIVLPAEVLLGITPEEREALLRAGRAPAAVPHGDQRLPAAMAGADGAGRHGRWQGDGPDGGQAAGQPPRCRDRARRRQDVVLTHMHVDHVGGLLDQAGARAFLNAQLWVAEDGDRLLAGRRQEGRRAGGNTEAVSTWPGSWCGRMPTACIGSHTGRSCPGSKPSPRRDIRRATPATCCSSAGAKLLIWGDVVHVPAVQTARPDVEHELRQ